jgi:lipopolysaccharide cholinephosphotransferase
MKKKLSPIQVELLRLFKEIRDLLEKNKIEYFACGGTLIGAVREKGFIPWDDDIDLFMTRPNYDKLLKLARKNNGKIGKFDVACSELDNSLLPFCKIFDKRYALNDKGVEGDENYLFIDIFPLDAIPEDRAEQAEYFAKIFKMRKLAGVSRIKYSYLWHITENKALFLPKVILKTYVNLRGPKIYLRKYIELCKKYNQNYKRAKFVSSNVWGKGVIENFEKSELEIMTAKFEDTKINIPKGYDRYLTALYGDYMTPPKKSERETHDIEIIKQKEK